MTIQTDTKTLVYAFYSAQSKPHLYGSHNSELAVNRCHYIDHGRSLKEQGYDWQNMMWHVGGCTIVIYWYLSDEFLVVLSWTTNYTWGTDKYIAVWGIITVFGHCRKYDDLSLAVWPVWQFDHYFMLYLSHFVHKRVLTLQVFFLNNSLYSSLVRYLDFPIHFISVTHCSLSC